MGRFPHGVFIPHGRIGLLDRLKVVVFIILLLVSRLLTILINTSSIMLLIVQILIPERSQRFLVISRSYLNLKTAFKVILLHLILVTHNPLFILLLSHQVHRVLSIPLPHHELEMLILHRIVLLPPCSHFISKRCILVGNSYLSVEAILFFLQFLESVFHE